VSKEHISYHVKAALKKKKLELSIFPNPININPNTGTTEVVKLAIAEIQNLGEAWRLGTLLKILLALPSSSASSEGSFSSLRRLKTYLRSTISQTIDYLSCKFNRIKLTIWNLMLLLKNVLPRI